MGRMAAEERDLRHVESGSTVAFPENMFLKGHMECDLMPTLSGIE